MVRLAARSAQNTQVDARLADEASKLAGKISIKRQASESSTSPFPEQDYLRGLKENNQIKKYGVVLDIIKVILQFLDRILNGGAIGITYLGPAGDARLDGMP